MKANFDLILYNEEPAVPVMGREPKNSPHRIKSANSLMDTLLDTPHPSKEGGERSEDRVAGLYSSLREHARKKRKKRNQENSLQMALSFNS